MLSGMTTAYHKLDYNGLYSLKLDYDPAQTQLQITVTDDGRPWERLVENLLYQLNVTRDEELTVIKEGRTVTVKPVTRRFNLLLGKERIGAYEVGTDGRLERVHTRQLTVTETRRMGTFHQCEPYQLPRETEDQRELVRIAKSAVTTDFHTHSSGQISSHGLIGVAREHDAYYPISLLNDAGIDTSLHRFPDEIRKNIPRVPFPPKDVPGMPDTVEAVPLRALNDQEIALLAARMAMPTDKQSTYIEMENDANQFRYPLSKNDTIYGDTTLKIAEEYATQGVRYGEMATVGLQKPDMLKVIHDAQWKVETTDSTKDMNLRYMYAIPRTQPIEQIRDHLERVKIVSASPYVVGTDFVGQEVNKTREFGEALDDFCEWANDNRPGFTIRMHAGENDKNLDNVKDFLRLALKYPNLRFRIGHGIYGMDKEALELAKQLCSDASNPRLLVELNPASNVALNNVDDVSGIPFKKLLDNGIPFTINSDSYGTYTTTSTQLGIDALFAGLDSKGFEQLREWQDVIMNQMLDHSRDKAAVIDGWDQQKGRKTFLDGMIAALNKIPAPKLPPKKPFDEDAMRAKLREDNVVMLKRTDKPAELQPDRREQIMLLGASGESWNRMTKQQKFDSAVAINMLTLALDPAHAYFAQGRSKPVGINRALNLSQRALAVNDNEAPKFYNTGTHVGDNFDERDSYKHLTHMFHVPGRPLDVPDTLLDQVFEKKGTLIAIGGASFTRDIITKADIRGIRDDKQQLMLLLQCAQGASAEKAAVLHPDYAAIDGKDMIRKLYDHYRANDQQIFRADFDIATLDELYEQACENVKNLKLDTPDPVVAGDGLAHEGRHAQATSAGRSRTGKKTG